MIINLVNKIKTYFQIKKIPQDFYSCCFLEYGGIHFVQGGAVRPCCSLSDYSYELFSQLEYKTTKDYFDVEQYKKHILNIKNRNLSKKPICHKCDYYQKAQWKRINTPYVINHHLILSHYGTCNFSCDYCTIPEDMRKSKSEDIFPQIKSMLEQHLINPHAIIEFSGREPSILFNLEKILDEFKTNGNPIIFYTNASKFSSHIDNYLKLSNESYIVSSLDCGTTETFIRKRGLDMFEKVVNNLEAYTQNKNDQAKSKVVLKYIFSENNLSSDDINGFLNITKKINPFKVILSPDFTVVFNEENNLNHIYEEIISIMENMKSKLLDMGYVVDIVAHTKELSGVFYPKGEDGEKRLYRTYLPKA